MNPGATGYKDEPFLAFALLLLILITFSLTILIAGYWLNVSLVHYALPIAFLPSMALTYGYFFGLSRKNIVVGLISAAVLAYAGVASRHMPDFTVNGISYHQPSAEALLNGWNPIRTDTDPIWQQNLYPFGAWAVEAFLAGIYGSTEAGKVLYIWWLFIAIPVLLAGLRNTLGGLQFRHYMLAWLMVFNPVVICQILTNWVDGLLYLEGMTFLGAVLMQGDSPHRNRMPLLIMGASLLFMITTKLSGIYYGLMLCAGTVWYLYLPRKEIPWKTTGILLAAGAVSTVIFAYHPYVRNMLRYGSLFPWDPNGLVTVVLPPNYMHLPAAARFLHSILSATNEMAGVPAMLKWPWIVYEDEWFKGSPALLNGGFGPLFAMGTALAILLFLSDYFYEREEKHGSADIYKGLLSFACIFFIFSMLFPQGWWARWAPFVYAVPFLLLLALPNCRGSSRFVLCTILLIFTINSFSTAIGMYLYQCRLQISFYQAVDILHKAPPHSAYLVPVGPGENYKATTQAYLVLQHRLQEQGIDSVVKVGAPCNHRAGYWAEFDVCY